VNGFHFVSLILHPVAARGTDPTGTCQSREKQDQKRVYNIVSLILQVVGLASTLLQLVRLSCLLADTPKKTMENELTVQLQ
jgi:hypothetical protein